eukprot:m.403913 g.403913  ORF g.403913 m.403913 type:complete len:316 (-) comp21196_c1_seq1:1691-2638(-)
MGGFHWCTSVSTMRKTFEAGSTKQLLHWFPGHMAKGMRLMRKHINRCDAVIEVHDARIPFTARNDKFDLLADKPRLLVLNKGDLAGTLDDSSWQSKTDLVTNCTLNSSPQVMQIIPRLLDVVDPGSLQRQPSFLRIMIAGLPNVGKSSLINALRRMYSGRKKAARTGNSPGVTRALQTDIKINDYPPIYMVDTPGVMLPKVPSVEVGLTLALVGTLRDDLVGHELIADFLLYNLNKRLQFTYVERFGLEAPCDDINIVLPAIARRIGALRPGAEPNLELAAEHFVSKYRSGALGRFVLDDSGCHDNHDTTPSSAS